MQDYSLDLTIGPSSVHVHNLLEPDWSEKAGCVKGVL